MLKAGAASVDITPDPVRGTYLAGFAMGRTATGVHMRLAATSLYLTDGDEELVLVSADLTGLLRPWIERIRSRAGIDGSKIVFACTHTHSAPDTMGYWGPSILKLFPRSDGKDPAYMFALVESVARCIDQAVANARDATLRVASFAVPEEWSRNDRKGGGRFDDAVAIGLDDDRGHRVATVLGYASHPEALWEDNREVSPDYPGHFREHIRTLTGGEALFFNGPLGAMLTPNVDPNARIEERKDYIERLGRFLAEETERRLAAVEPEAAATITHDVRPVRFGNTNWRFRLLERLGFVDVRTEGDTVESVVHTVRIGDIALATAPGEVCPELGRRLVDRLPGRHRWLIGLGEDEFGYMLEPAMFDDQEYSYEHTMSLGRETADALIAAYGDFLVEP